MSKINKKIVSYMLALALLLGSVSILTELQKIQAASSDDYDVYYDFSTQDLTKITDYSAMKYNKTTYAQETGTFKLTDQWWNPITGSPFGGTPSRANDGMKLRANDAAIYRLNLATAKKNFEVTSEIYHKDDYGIVFGKSNAAPYRKSTEVASVRFAPVSTTNSGLILEGMTVNSFKGCTKNVVDLSQTANANGDIECYRMGISAINYTNEDKSNINKLFKLNIKVTGKAVCIGLDYNDDGKYETVINATLSDDYVMESIGLFAREYISGGGFKNIGVKYYKDDDITYDFTTQDLNQITDYTETKYDPSTYQPVAGTYKLTDHWWSSVTGSATGVMSGRENDGLKVKAQNQFIYRLDLADANDIFEVATDIYHKDNYGIVFGKSGVSPYKKSTQVASVRFAPVSTTNSGLILEGMTVDSFTGCTKNVVDLSQTANANGDIECYRMGISAINYTNADKSNINKLYRLKIRVVRKSVIIGLDYNNDGKYETVINATLSDDYVMDSIGLCGQEYQGGGGFKNITINYYDDVYYDFSTQDLTKIIDYSATKYNITTFATDGKTYPLTDCWWNPITGTPYSTVTAGRENDGLKLRAHNAMIYRLDLAKAEKSFEVTSEIYHKDNYGIVFGKSGVSPYKKSTQVASVRFAPVSTTNSGLILEGMTVNSFKGCTKNDVDLSQTANANSAIECYRMGISAINYKDSDKSNINKLFKLNIKVDDKAVTIGLDYNNDGIYETVIDATLSDDYVMDSIGLCAQEFTGGGGFKNIRVKYNDYDYLSSFDNKDLSDLEADGWASVKYNYVTDVATRTTSLSDHWFTGTDGYPETVTQYKNPGLKAKVADGDKERYLLEYPEDVANFEASFSFYQNIYGYGMVFGQREKFPTNSGDSACRVYMDGRILCICGDVDLNSAVVENGTDSTLVVNEERSRIEYNLSEFGIVYENSGTKVVTFHVKVQDGKLTVSVNDSDFALTVNLTANYENGTISLVSPGCQAGGFKSFTLRNLDPTEDPGDGQLNYSMASKNNYAVVSISTNKTYSKVTADLSYDSAKYNYVNAKFGSEHSSANWKNEIAVEDGIGTIEAYSTGDSDIVNLYFMTNDGSLADDFTGFAFTNSKLNLAGIDGDCACTVTQTLDKDYYEDSRINLLDLVAAKKVPVDANELVDVCKMLLGIASSLLTIKDTTYAIPEISVEWQNPTNIVNMDKQESQFVVSTATDKGKTNELSLSFPKDGGVRLNADQTGFFNPSEVSVIGYTEDENTVTMQANDTTVIFNKAVTPWSFEVYNADNEKVTEYSADNMYFGYDNNEDLRKVKIVSSVDKDEKLFGLGERFSGLLQNNKTVELWNFDSFAQLALENGDHNVGYKNIPILHSNKGYSVFHNNTYYGIADVADENANECSFEFYGPILDMYVWTGSTVENIARYNELTGSTVTVPKDAISYWAGQSSSIWYKDGTDANTIKNKIGDVIDKYESLGTPIKTLYLEGVGIKSQYNSIHEYLQERNVNFIGWMKSTYATNDSDYTPDAAAAALGVNPSNLLVKKNGSDLSLSGERFLDYTNPLAKSWLSNVLTKFMPKGLYGMMLDYNDTIPVNANYPSANLNGDQMHNLSQYYYSKAVYDVFKDYYGEGNFINIVRAGCAGSQSFGATFAGDQSSTFTGLQEVVSALLSSSASGINVWGSDIGGLGHKTDEDAHDSELYARWLQFGTFSPLMRAHGQTSSRDPWDYEKGLWEQWISKPTQARFKKYYWTRENIVDLVNSGIIRASVENYPLTQSMIVAYPKETRLATNESQYLFCDSLLVAPVTQSGATSVKVQFPKGRWVSIWDGSVEQGNSNKVIAADLNTIPVYLEAGSAIPVTFGEDLKFGTNNTSGKNVDALVVAPAVENKVNTVYSDKNTKKTITCNTSGNNTCRVTVNSANNQRIIVVMGAVANSVKVGNIQLTQLGQRPTSASTTVGYYRDTTNNSTIIVTDGNWSTLQYSF